MKKVMDIKTGLSYDSSFVLDEITKQYELNCKNHLDAKFFHHNPHKIQIELTRKCNLKCKFCYNSSGKKMLTEMKDDEILGFVSDAINFGVKLLIFSGGEIFCKKELLYKCINMCHENGVLINLITNATLINSEDLSFLKGKRDSINMIQISLDGSTPEHHDNLRGVPGSWEKTIRSICFLRQASMPVKIGSVISSENFSQISDIAELSYFLDVKELQYGIVIKKGRAITTNCSLSKEKYEEFFNIMTKLHKKYENKLDVYCSQPLSFTYKYNKIFPLNSFEIRSDGSVYKTCLSNKCLGSLKCNNLIELWNQMSKEWNKIRISDDIDQPSENIV